MAIGATVFIVRLEQKVKQHEQTIKKLALVDRVKRIEGNISVVMTYISRAVGPEKASEILAKLFEDRGEKND